MWCEPSVIECSLSMTSTSCPPNGFAKFWQRNASAPGSTRNGSVVSVTSFGGGVGDCVPPLPPAPLLLLPARPPLPPLPPTAPAPPRPDTPSMHVAPVGQSACSGSCARPP